MKIYSGLDKLIYLFCLALVFVLIGNTTHVYAQTPSLIVLGDTGENTFYNVGDQIETTFFASVDGLPVSGEELDIEYSGLTNVTITNESTTRVMNQGVTTTKAETDFAGTVTVRGTITSRQDYVKATWADRDLEATAFFNVNPVLIPALIVVNQLVPKYPLSVGDTFTCKITIENPDSEWSTLPVTAWQMDIIFDPTILEVTNVTEGDFLEDEDDEDDALFFPQIVQNSDDSKAVDASETELAKINLNGRINATQAFYGNDSPGVPLPANGKKTLLTITFKVRTYAEEALGIHNVLILTNKDANKDGRTPDRVSYAIFIKDVFVATEDSAFYRHDVNQDGNVDILDLELASNLRADINGDDVFNLLDLLAISLRIRNTSGAATPLTINTPLTEMIEPGDDIDYFSIHVVQSGQLTLWTTGNLDTVGALKDSAGNILHWDDDGGTDYNFRIEADLSPGTYYLRVQGLDESEIGEYTVHAAFEIASIPEDINGDGVVNIIDLTFAVANFGATGTNTADVNNDGVVDIVDLVLIAAAFGDTAAAPLMWDLDSGLAPTRADVIDWINEARQLNLADPAFQRGIAVLESLLKALTPKSTALLPNYPNPSNPETWIPYQLAKDSKVTITVYATDGTLVRTLSLGHKTSGLYRSKNRAAYWDGKNEFGERVASGLYFYTLTAGQYSATGKMLIRK